MISLVLHFQSPPLPILVPNINRQPCIATIWVTWHHRLRSPVIAWRHRSPDHWTWYNGCLYISSPQKPTRYLTWLLRFYVSKFSQAYFHSKRIEPHFTISGAKQWSVYTCIRTWNVRYAGYLKHLWGVYTTSTKCYNWFLDTCVLVLMLHSYKFLRKFHVWQIMWPRYRGSSTNVIPSLRDSRPCILNVLYGVTDSTVKFPPISTAIPPLLFNLKLHYFDFLWTWLTTSRTTSCVRHDAVDLWHAFDLSVTSCCGLVVTLTVAYSAHKSTTNGQQVEVSGVGALVGVDAGVTASGALASDGDLEVERDPDVVVRVADGGRRRQTVECLAVWQPTQQSDRVPAWNALIQTKHARACTHTPTALNDRRKHILTHAQTTFLHLAQVGWSTTMSTTTTMMTMMTLCRWRASSSRHQRSRLLLQSQNVLYSPWNGSKINNITKKYNE